MEPFWGAVAGLAAEADWGWGGGWPWLQPQGAALQSLAAGAAFMGIGVFEGSLIMMVIR